MTIQFYSVLYAILGTIIESASDVFLKYSLLLPSNFFYVVGIIGYGITGILFTQMLKTEKLASANIIWHIIHFSILFLVSKFYFNDSYSYQEVIGFLLAILSFFLLSSHSH